MYTGRPVDVFVSTRHLPVYLPNFPFQSLIARLETSTTCVDSSVALMLDCCVFITVLCVVVGPAGDLNGIGRLLLVVNAFLPCFLGVSMGLLLLDLLGRLSTTESPLLLLCGLESVV